MRALAAASLLAFAFLAGPTAASPIGGECDGTVDTLCGDPEGTPGGTTCYLAVGGSCLAWL